MYTPHSTMHHVLYKTNGFQGNLVQVEVGSWDSINKFKLFKEKITWRKGQNSPPESVCAKPCPARHFRLVQTACCWTCHKCRPNEVGVFAIATIAFLISQYHFSVQLMSLCNSCRLYYRVAKGVSAVRSCIGRIREVNGVNQSQHT